MPGQLRYYFRRTKRAVMGAMIPDAWRKKAFYLKEEYPGEFVYEGEFLKLVKFNCRIKVGDFYFVLERYDVLLILQTTLNAQVSIEDDRLTVSFNGLVFNPTTAEELFILEEVYVNGTYNFQTNHPVTVVDVGMNVGFASLFFAHHQQVGAVYSFEPFEPTFRQAINNIALNPTLKEKIKPANYGLGDREESLTVDYNYENKGQVGVYGTSLIRSDINHSEKVTIKLKAAAGEIKKIIDQHSGQHFMLKLDCEGAEYAILRSLAAENLLNFFDIIFIEWHEKGPEELLAILKNKNFSAFYQQASAKKVGMIYAVQ
jgi:FkbM family methyltransferase